MLRGDAARVAAREAHHSQAPRPGGVEMADDGVLRIKLLQLYAAHRRMHDAVDSRAETRAQKRAHAQTP